MLMQEADHETRSLTGANTDRPETQTQNDDTHHRECDRPGYYDCRYVFRPLISLRVTDMTVPYCEGKQHTWLSNPIEEGCPVILQPRSKSIGVPKRAGKSPDGQAVHDELVERLTDITGTESFDPRTK
jgi:hypothetical protein